MDEKEWKRQRFSLAGRIFYPNLFEPKEDKQGRLKYQVLFTWPLVDPKQDQQVQAIGAHLTAGIQKFFPNIAPQYLKLPVKKWGEYKKQDGSDPSEILRDQRWMNLSSGKDFPPKVVHQNKQDVLDRAEVYSGRNAVAQFSFYKFDVDGNKGIGVNVRAVMLLPGGEQEGGGSVNLDEAFGQFIDTSAPVGALPQGDGVPPVGGSAGSII